MAADYLNINSNNLTHTVYPIIKDVYPTPIKSNN